MPTCARAPESPVTRSRSRPMPADAKARWSRTTRGRHPDQLPWRPLWRPTRARSWGRRGVPPGRSSGHLEVCPFGGCGRESSRAPPHSRAVERPGTRGKTDTDGQDRSTSATTTRLPPVACERARHRLWPLRSGPGRNAVSRAFVHPRLRSRPNPNRHVSPSSDERSWRHAAAASPSATRQKAPTNPCGRDTRPRCRKWKARSAAGRAPRSSAAGAGRAICPRDEGPRRSRRSRPPDRAHPQQPIPTAGPRIIRPWFRCLDGRRRPRSRGRRTATS